eukprot:COSAG05_NODE_26395_length_188_cov_87.831461_1_plen_44_part_01
MPTVCLALFFAPHRFYGSVLESEAEFEEEIHELCRELGERGRLQ